MRPGHVSYHKAASDALSKSEGKEKDLVKRRVDQKNSVNNYNIYGKVYLKILTFQV